MLAHKNIAKDLLRFLFWFPFRWLIMALPFSASYWLGGLFGSIDYLISGKKRINTMQANLCLAFPDMAQSEARALVRRNLQNHLRNMLELMKYPCLNRDDAERLGEIQGIEHLDRGLENGHGVILLTAHFGAKQFLQIALGLAGYKLNQINYHMESTELSFIQKQVSQRGRIAIEEKLPITFISAKGFMRPLFSCLKKNEVLIIAGDGIGIPGHMDNSYRPMEFRGQRMLFPTNAASLAERTKAVLIPVFVVRQGAGHRIIFEPPLELYAGTPEKTVAQYVRHLDKHLTDYPFLWEFWEEWDSLLAKESVK